MQKLRLVTIAIAAVSLASAFQIVQPPRSPYERRGIFHATVHGRVVSPSGDPVGGVHIQLLAGAPRALPLVDAVTGADGRFTISDVNSVYSPYIAWFPPEEWLDGGKPLVGESGADVDAGMVQLSPATILHVAVELVGGAAGAAGDREREPSITLEPNISFGFGQRPFFTPGQKPVPRLLKRPLVARRSGGEMILRGAPIEGDGTWQVALYRDRKMERYSALFQAQPEKRNRKFTFRLLRDSVVPNGQLFLDGQMEVSESSVAETPVAPELNVIEKVVGPDGTPIEGAIVSDFGLPISRSLRQWVRTGADGNFNLRTREEHAMPSVSYGDSDYWSLFTPSDRERLRTSHTIVMPSPSRLSIRVSGIDASKVNAAWWHDSFGWQRFSSLNPWCPSGDIWHAQIRVAADGYLPLMQKLEIPRDPSQKTPPAEVPLKFEFASGVRRTLNVFAAGKPVAGAIVDVESIVNLASDERRVVDTYRLPADGRLQLLGGGDQLVEVFVYADGFEPHRAMWNAGTPLTVSLEPRSASLEFPASSAAAVARIRDAGSPRAVRTVFLHADPLTSTPIAPGVYDISCYKASGAIAGYQRLAVAAGSAAKVDCSLDQRPQLTVRLPGEGWRLSVTQSTPRGGATEWAAMIAVPGAPEFPEAGATVLRESQSEPVFSLSYAGKWHIEAREGRRTLSLWRDIDVQPGASLTVALPAGMGTLKGSMRTYGGGLEMEVHGFAGPRLQLIADDPDGWSVTEYLPKRDSRDGEEKHHFTLIGIPAGNYHLYQHLIGKPETLTMGSKSMNFTAPIAAWGGVPVHIEANSDTTLKDFIEFPLGDLKVRVSDANGRPVEHATLRIRDRMSDSWRQVEENPMQLEQAAHPIPYPAAVRIVGGLATLPSIREGWLELTVESDNGPAVSFTVPVLPTREVTLKLPPENR